MKFSRTTFLFIIVFFLAGCANQKSLHSEEKITQNECEGLIEIGPNESELHKGFYCLTDINRLAKLHYKSHIYYIGTNDNYHFFSWFIKQQLYENRPVGFAVPISNYQPKENLKIKESKIGENLFPE